MMTNSNGNDLYFCFFEMAFKSLKSPSKVDFESFYRGVNFESLLGLDLFSVLPTLVECSALMMGLIKKPGLLTLACLPLGPECLSSISPAF